MGLDLPADALAALGSRTEGQIAGLQMAGLWVQGRRCREDSPDLRAEIETFTGSHRLVLDYLLEEVLNSVADAVQPQGRPTLAAREQPGGVYGGGAKL